MNDKFKIFFTIHFNSAEYAEITYLALSPEVRDHRFERSKVSINLKTKKIVFDVSAQDFNAAKASISSILRWISSISETLDTLSKENLEIVE
jgi:tRNA threonylcarbamoyladenosine modification (KEOPS) complex  Pcc1 subunit